MSTIGLTKEALDKILEENGIGESETVSAQNIRNAISTAITENNKVIEKKVSELVSQNLINGRPEKKREVDLQRPFR